MISKSRREELLDLWFEETNEDWTQEWRGRLSEAEAALVDSWDRQDCQAEYLLLNSIQKLENK